MKRLYIKCALRLFFYAPLCPGAAISSPFSDEDPAIVTGRAPTTFHTKLSVAVDEADNRRLALKIVTHESGRLDASGAAVKPEQFDHVFVGEAAESDADTFHFTDMHSTHMTLNSANADCARAGPEGGFKSATPRHGEVCVAREVEGTGMHRTLRTQVRISEKMAATCTGYDLLLFSYERLMCMFEYVFVCVLRLLRHIFYPFCDTFCTNFSSFLPLFIHF